MQLQDWVGKRSGDTEVRQGGSDRTNDDQIGIGAGDNEAANPNIVTSFHVHSSREVLGLACRGGRARSRESGIRAISCPDIIRGRHAKVIHRAGAQASQCRTHRHCCKPAACTRNRSGAAVAGRQTILKLISRLTAEWIDSPIQSRSRVANI